MLKCLYCGAIFEDSEAKKEREYMGEHFGYPAYDTVLVCPECGCSELEEHVDFEDVENDE